MGFLILIRKNYLLLLFILGVSCQPILSTFQKQLLQEHGILPRTSYRRLINNNENYNSLQDPVPVSVSSSPEEIVFQALKKAGTDSVLHERHRWDKPPLNIFKNQNDDGTVDVLSSSELISPDRSESTTAQQEAMKYFHYPFVEEDERDEDQPSFQDIIRSNEHCKSQNIPIVDDFDKPDAFKVDDNIIPLNYYAQHFQKNSFNDWEKHNLRDSEQRRKLWESYFGGVNNNDDRVINPNDGEKRSAYRTIKREKLRKQNQFIPSVSVGAISHLGNFFDNIKNNIDVLERKELSKQQIALLEGDHPVSSLQKELTHEHLSSRPTGGNKPTGTAAFLHAVRTYRPSQRVRALVSMTPEGYHGSNFLDPNYMWVGLGKKK